LPPNSGVSDTVAVFESPVDSLSHQVLYPGFGGWRLSLGCTALSALTNFLERHSEVKNCIACVDADDAGNRAAVKIANIQGITVARSVPLAGKDWNDVLTITKSSNKTSLIGQLEAAKAIANEINSPTGKERSGGAVCL
jgi:hypothetical protein